MNESWFDITSNEDFESAMFYGCSEFYSLILKDVFQQLLLHYGESYFSLSEDKIKLSAQRALACVFMERKLDKKDFTDINLCWYYYQKCIQEFRKEKLSEIQFQKKQRLNELLMSEFVLNYQG